jgi:hypothetical protein
MMRKFLIKHHGIHYNSLIQFVQSILDKYYQLECCKLICESTGAKRLIRLPAPFSDGGFREE